MMSQIGSVSVSDEELSLLRLVAVRRFLQERNTFLHDIAEASRGSIIPREFVDRFVSVGLIKKAPFTISGVSDPSVYIINPTEILLKYFSNEK